MTKKSLVLSVVALSFLPVLASAQFGGVNTFMNDIVTFIENAVIPFLLAIALLVFIFGMFKYFIQGGNDADKQKEGRDLVLWSIVGFVLIVSIWGIVNVVSRGLGFRDQTLEDKPELINVQQGSTNTRRD